MFKASVNNIISFLLSTCNIAVDSDTFEVYSYGLECILNNFIIFFFLIIISLFTCSLSSTLIWLSAFILLRHNTGGYHASTHLGCIVSSIALGITNIIVSNNIVYSNALAFVSGSFTLLICFFLSPIQVSKHKVTYIQAIIYKIKSLAIIIVGYSVSFILPSKQAISIVYAFTCCSILIIGARIISSNYNVHSKKIH